MDMTGKHILVVGFRGKASHIASAQMEGATMDLLIDASEMKNEYHDEFHSVYVVDDIYDWKQIEPIVSAHAYDGVMTRFEDFTTVVAAITDYLHLPGVAFEDAPNFRNKFKMREAFAAHNVPSADFVLVQSIGDAEEFLKDHTFPLIVKQISGIHSKYVAKVESREELSKMIDTFLQCLDTEEDLIFGQLHGYKEVNVPDPRTHLLVEECLTGEELTVDAFVVDGTIYTMPICKYTMPEDLGIDDHHLPIRTMPYNLSDAERTIVYNAVEAALKALGANACVTHTEVFFDRGKQECRLIEVASRGGGFRAEMLHYGSGDDYDRGVVRASLGLDPLVGTQPKAFTAVGEVFAPKNGILEAIDYTCLENQDDIHRLTINRDVGQEVGRASDGKSFILKFLVLADSYEQAILRAEGLVLKVRNSIEVRQA